MRRKRGLMAIATTTVCLTAIVPAASASAGPGSRVAPGAPGSGDPYFPLEGNGGYDAQHYDVAFSYDPATHRLDGTTTMTARAGQTLSRFDLALQQLDVARVTVDGR